jgi:large conductance mechanosensitive channel
MLSVLMVIVWHFSRPFLWSLSSLLLEDRVHSVQFLARPVAAGLSGEQFVCQPAGFRGIMSACKGPGRMSMSLLKEFRAFIARGNVADLAVGVIVGGAFNKIVTSLVNDILMPIAGLALGGVDFTSLSFTVGEAVIGYGQFLQSVTDFLIVAFVVFLIVRFLNRIRKYTIREKKEEE